MVLISWTSLQGIVRIDVSPLEAEQPQSEVVVQAPEPLQYQAQEPASSFGLLAAVVVCCGATSMLLARQLRSRKPVPERHVIKRAAPLQPLALAVATVPSPNQSRPQAASVPMQVTSSHGSKNQRSKTKVSTPSKSKAKPKAAVFANRAKLASPTQPVVNLVTYSEDYPVEWHEPGLAEMMDIRKRGSMSSY